MTQTLITPAQASRTIYGGQLAYYRTVHGGLLKVRVLEYDLKDSQSDFRLLVTGYGTCDSSIWKVGEIIPSSSHHIVHRDAVKVRRGRYVELWRPRFSHRWWDYPADRELNGAKFAQDNFVIDREG